MENYQLNDPDFDEAKTGAENLKMFIGGIVVGVMALCTIGFFILLKASLR